MACVGEKGRPGTHVGEMTTFPFETQFLLDATLLCYQVHQRFGLMGIELISDKDPAGLRMRLDSLGDMRGKVGKGRAGVQCWEPQVVRSRRPGWRSNSACHAACLRIPLAQHDWAAWARMDGAAQEPECRSSHRYSSHGHLAPQARELPGRLHTPYRFARSVQWGHLAGE